MGLGSRLGLGLGFGCSGLGLSCATMRQAMTSVRQTMRVARGSLRNSPRSPKKEPNLPGEYGRVSFHSHVPGMVMPGQGEGEGWG